MPYFQPEADIAAPAQRPADELKARYQKVRAASLRLAAPLSPEDQAAQSMPDASPVKWHLAHTSWFFETFVLAETAGYPLFNASYGYLFNSYYEALGPRQPRPQRGLLTRPSVSEILEFRAHVDRHMAMLLDRDVSPAQADLVRLGLAHEEQHQELLLTDVLHLLAQNPLRPAYDPEWRTPHFPPPASLRFAEFDGGVVEIGQTGTGFSFDNEGPRHEALLRPFRLADRLATNAEWLAFIEDGGYRNAELWLSDGLARLNEEGWEAPLYWEKRDGQWLAFGLSGLKPIDPDAPVTNVSFYEADAFARWSGLRLPTEMEWEHAAVSTQAANLRQLYDQAWQWTASPYAPYPGYRPPAGAVGEYNGKFMINQMVLRGGSLATSERHTRASYRNFFHPHQRWQFTGVRLAEDLEPKRRSAAPRDDTFRTDVEAGLSAPRKHLSSKYFYDAEGSKLFEDICRLPEYYPTRVETALLQEIAGELAASAPAGGVLVEFGSGDSVKTEILLRAAPQLEAYAPLDISPSALDEAAARIRRRIPGLAVEPIIGDFTGPIRLPARLADRPLMGFFPGSTIGNFVPAEAGAFLERARAFLGSGARFVVGVDVAKDCAVLEAAYDDAAGVTAAFNLNLLTRINRELGADFDIPAFAHRAIWNEEESRVEMHLVSLREQTVRLGVRRFNFAEGETIHTENSYKYPPGRFEALAETAGWRVDGRWTAPAPAFNIFMLTT